MAQFNIVYMNHVSPHHIPTLTVQPIREILNQYELRTFDESQPSSAEAVLEELCFFSEFVSTSTQMEARSFLPRITTWAS